MLDSELKFYLKTNLEAPKVDFVWSDEDNEKLFAYLNENCDEECLVSTENQQKIKQAFKEYFESVGYILFKMSDGKIRLRVFPYKIEPKDSINLPALIEILKSNDQLIHYDYKGNQNQISIPKKLKLKIYDFIYNIKNEEINRKELARYAVNEYFELKPHDIVVVKDDQIFIKILDKKYRREVKEEEKETIANRYNGIDEKELEALYDEFFEKQENKNFFYYIAKLFVQMYLIEEKIDNLTYEKKNFAYIQQIIVEQMNNTYNHDNDFCTGFSGYIFRIHFHEVFEHIATFILAEIAASNDYMIEFLKYYSSNIIVLEGHKYKVPELETEGGLKWNVISMLSIVKIYMKAKKSIDALKKETNELKRRIQLLYIGQLTPLEFQNKLTKEMDALVQAINADEKKLERYTDSYDLTTDDNRKATLKHEIRQIKEEIQEKREHRAKLKAKTVSKGTLAEYNRLRQELDGMVRHMHREERVLEQNESSYLSIKGALVKALISKKKLIA